MKVCVFVPVDERSFDWREACVDCESFLSRWAHYEDTMAHLKFTRSVYASIDAVHLMHVSSLKSDLTNNGFMVNLCLKQHTAVFALGFFKCGPRSPWV